MSNYTKGPWAVEISHDIAWIGQLRSTSGFDRIICHIAIDKDYKQEVKDRILCDAKLIAAAPELLEACINAAKYFEEWSSTTGRTIEQELKLAIKKATT